MVEDQAMNKVPVKHFMIIIELLVSSTLSVFNVVKTYLLKELFKIILLLS